MVGDIGYWISFIAIQAYTAEVTDDSAMWLGVIYFAMLAPMLLFAPLTGVVADRVDRKRLLVVGRTVVAVLGAVVAALILTGVATAGVITAMAFLLGATYAFLGPAQAAALANSVADADLLSAVAMASAGNNLCRIAGPALAAPVLAAWGAGWAFAIYAAASVTVAGLILPLRLRSRPPVHDDQGPWRRWKDGLRHARERPPAARALVTMAVFSVFGAAQLALYPVFASEVFDRPTNDFTIIVVASGIGAVGGAVGNAFRHRVPGLRSSLWWLVGFSVASIGFAVCGSWWVALVFVMVGGFCYFSMTTALNTLLQHLADDEKRGRMMSLFIVCWGGLVPIGAIWMGAASDALSPQAVVAFGAAVCLVFALAQLVWDRARRPQTSTAPLR
jgi:MFS family permease